MSSRTGAQPQMKPRVSVIIPVFNSEEYLEQCVQSILDQELQSLEVILVDDGSDDKSVQIAKSFQEKDSRIRLLELDHVGAGVARNRGLAEAKGEYIQFLDSDDWAAPSMLREMVASADAHSSDIVVSQAFEFDDATGREWVAGWMCKYHLLPSRVFCWKDVPEYIFTAFPALVWNKLFRRSFIEREHLVFQDIPRNNDVFFMGTAAVAAERISIQHGAYVHHRVSNPNSCQATREKFPQGFVLSRVALLDELKRRGVYEDSPDQPGVKKDFLNQALDTSINMLTKFKTVEAFNAACEALVPVPQGPSSLGFEELEYSQYRNKRNWRLYQIIESQQGEDRLFNWGRAMFELYKESDEKLKRRDSRFSARALRKAKHAARKLGNRFVGR